MERMKAQLGAEFPAFLESLERPRAVALRFNPLKGKDLTLPFLREPVSWEPEGFYFDPDSRPALHPFHDAGLYYLQEASAMAPVALLDPQPGEAVCDLCAAPGGKTTQIAGRLLGRGFLLSNEIHPKRAKILSGNVERMGVPNALVTNERPKTLADRFPGFFHRVLVDAPCSGEGMFRKEAAAVTDWSPETVKMCAQRQEEILEEAAKMLRPGGRLVYSTCTFSPEENEQVVAAFLTAHPDFSPAQVSGPWFQPTENGGFRLWPHKLRGEGHFAAVLQKNSGEMGAFSPVSGENAPKALTQTLESLGFSLGEGRLLSFGDTWFQVPEAMPDLRGLRVLRPGLELGTVKKDRLEPAHALALHLKTCPRVVDLEGEAVSRYLRGETIPCAQKGWCLVRVGGFSLGWGKGDGVQLKNHYPKGLRHLG